MGDGVIVSELEANEMIASIRSRSSSESSSYSSRSESSTDTSLCDENEKASDSDQELPAEGNENKGHSFKNKKHLVSASPPLSEKNNSTPLALIKAPISTDASEPNKNIEPVDKNIKNITEYLDSAAGEPLRTYIDGFESKLKDSHIRSSDEKSYAPVSPFKCVRHHRIEYERNNLFHRPDYEDKRNQTNVNASKSKNVMELSPVDLSPCHCVGDYSTSYTTESRRPSTSKQSVLSSRPPDIIDSFAMYPNFVPDIDLSDKAVSDHESPPDSPGSESLIVSEDEPPIQLKIDKYFEHSPEFFGARLTDPNNFDIPSRRAIKRNSRLPRKPDSLTLQNNHNEKILKNDPERASSLPQTHSFVCKKSVSPNSREGKPDDVKISKVRQNNIKNVSDTKHEILTESSQDQEKNSSKEHVLHSGRKNSERALQIIQENSQILSRILTKQNISASLNNQLQDRKSVEDIMDRKFKDTITPTKSSETEVLDSPLLKESTSDSLIGCIKREKDEMSDKNDFLRVRPISIDDPFSFEVRNIQTGSDEFVLKNIKTPSIECLGNKTDYYGWENKGFLAKCDFKSSPSTDILNDEYRKKHTKHSELQNNNKRSTTEDWVRYSYSSDSSKISVTQPSSEIKDTSTYDKIFTSEDYNYPLSTSTKYDFRSAKVCETACKTEDQSPRIFESVLKTENSINTFSDFSNRVTSSISFTCEPSIDDDSPMGAKSNSSDTLCQITSLDQVSTPISPKIFPNRETPTLPKDQTERSDKTKLFESDDTSSAITSLLETDTLSSLSYPRSPTTGSYHPFPTRPAMRLPKDLGVRLGMYPKETISSPQK